MSANPKAQGLRALRFLLSMAIVAGGTQWLLASRVQAQLEEDEKPCEFMNPNDPDPEFRECKKVPHEYPEGSGNCEGIDCYNRMEECCEIIE